VPLYYENRIPELQLTNDDLNQDMAAVIEAADLDEDQERRLEREFARQYHLITRDERLEKIAEDIVAHVMGRGQPGKAMVVSIDKATAVRMYDKVRRYWNLYLARLRAELWESGADEARVSIAARIAYMEETDMAVVVSPAQNEARDFQDKGLDITGHRKRMDTQDLAGAFKDPNSPLRIVFVCAMWMTGFDAPSVSTIYLDKPMRNHTLMQTIARANRVFAGKANGLIVDYVGVFGNLQKALAIYGTDQGGGSVEGETPVKDKGALVADLRVALDDIGAFCAPLRIDPQVILASAGFDKIRGLDDAVEAILAADAAGEEKGTRRNLYLALAATVNRLYRAVLPDTAANPFGPLVTLYGVLAAKLLALRPEVDMSGVMDDVAGLLDASIATEGYIIRDPAVAYATDAGGRIDLAAIDVAALKARFAAGRAHTATEQLRGAINSRLQRMVRANKSRTDYLVEFQGLINDYNSGAVDVELMFSLLQVFNGKLDGEERRAIAENLTEEELAVFDLLTKPAPELTEEERVRTKRAARDLLETLKRETLTLDWRKRQQARAQVRDTIETALDRGLPEAYTTDLYEQKCAAIYRHVYDSYFGQSRSVYGPAA